jgi:L-methionine (R)-S-oxide reductase
MSDTLLINKNLSESEIWEILFSQIDSLINSNEPVLSNLANITAALKDAFVKISWVGFYLLKNEKLFLGPFQGKIACVTIEIGKGVCGTSALNKQSIIVNDVEEFPGHIACDSGSRSEIVVPLILDSSILGVLDLDSYQPSAFNSNDRFYLEKLCKLILDKLDNDKIASLIN